MSSTALTPSAARSSSRPTTASNVPSAVKVPTCSSYNTQVGRGRGRGPRLAPVALEEEHRQRGQRHDHREGAAVRGDRCGSHAAEVPDAAAAVLARVAVEQLPPVTLALDAQAVVVAGHRCEVRHDDDGVTSAAVTGPRQRAVGGVTRVDPVEAARVAIELV